MQLTQRQERILKAVVEQYVATAHPVGSLAIASTPGLEVSSATVRNEMGVLEDTGYIRHLHTSGGRVPTNEGYRYYVERLMDPTHLSHADARTIRHQFHQVHTEMQEWLKLAATIMAHRMRNVGLITAPRSTEVRLRHLEVISIQSTVALLIVVLQGGTVLQEMLNLPEPYTQEELSPVADRLSARLLGMSAGEIGDIISTMPPLEATLAMVATHLLQRGQQQHAPVFHAGLGDLIKQPEFVDHRPGEMGTARNERLHQMVEFLQHGFAVQQLLSSLAPESTVQIVIGGEVLPTGLSDYSFVLGRYGNSEESCGFLGIVGPTRMEYPRAVALVRYMTDLMTDLIHSY